MRQTLRLAVVLLATGLAAPELLAQQGGRTINDLLSRPSDRSASQRLGGRYTGSSQLPTLNVPQSQVATIGEQQLSFYQPKRSVSPYSTGMYGVQVGLTAPIGRSRRPSSLLVGLQLPNRVVGTSVLGGTRQPVPAIDAYQFTPRPPTTRFHDLMGLKPTLPAPRTAQAISIPERMEDDLAERVERARERGLALFKQATIEPVEINPVTGMQHYPDCPECRNRLVQAARELRMVDTLDDDAVAFLLLAHIALEQERPMTAAAYLLRAWKSDPSLFRNDITIDAYFGDADDSDTQSLFLEAQMRRYVQIGSVNPASPVAQVLEAYCAWRLGDRVRVREAVERADVLARQTPEKHAAVRAFAAALGER